MEFVEVLKELRDGQMLPELNNALGELVLHAQKTGKSGSLTLSIEIKPSGNDRMMVAAKTTAKIPAPNSLPSTFFVTEEGELSRKNPRQTTMGY